MKNYQVSNYLFNKDKHYNVVSNIKPTFSIMMACSHWIICKNIRSETGNIDEITTLRTNYITVTVFKSTVFDS